MFNFGVLGCGMIANIHAQAIQGIDNARLIGVADNKKEYAESFAQKYGVKAFHSFEDMLADKEIDVVCICTPSCFHASNAMQAMESGKHVVLEKPMAFTTEEADKVIQTSERTGKLITVISQLRFSPDILKLKELVANGAFGKITLCTLSMKYYRSKEYYASSPWKGTKKFDGGGALMNQGIHGIDILQYIVGDVVDVQGQVRTLSHDIEVEDTAVATVVFENGALGVIQGSSCCYPGFDRKIEIHGDRGYALLVENQIEKMMIDGEQISIELTQSEVNTASDPTALECGPHRKQMINLLNAIQGKEKLLVDGNEGKKAVRVIQTIYNTSK